MEQPISILSLVLNASLVVQLVMMLLLLASVLSWAVIVQRGRLLSRSKAELEEFESSFWSGVDLNNLYRECQQKFDPSAAELIFMAGLKEFSRLRQQGTTDSELLLVGVQRALRIAISREAEALDTHLPFLATVGSTSPYIGLFGTVWGIMHSFQGLATVKQATIATVAPGISEALVATAMGLLAAIPAVIFYNRYASKVEHLTNGYYTFAEEFSALLHRQALKLEQQQKQQQAQ